MATQSESRQVRKSARQTGNGQVNDQMVEMLTRAYSMELETVTNYLANSIHLDGMRAEEIKRALGSDIQEELGHATQLAHRIKQLHGRIPGSLELHFDQEAMRPPEDTTDLRSVIAGVIEAGSSAIAHYRNVIQHAEDTGDRVTADLATRLLAQEEEHLTLFEGFHAGLAAEKC